jgi:hypothetical protein
MRNSGDIPLAREEIECVQRQFRLLDDWKILYCEDENVPEGTMCHAGHIHFGGTGRGAEIEPCPEGVNVAEYLLHELLHIAVEVVARCRNRGKRNERAEILVRDICAVVKAKAAADCLVATPSPTFSTRR